MSMSDAIKASFGFAAGGVVDAVRPGDIASVPEVGITEVHRKSYAYRAAELGAGMEVATSGPDMSI